jgi:alkylation response protein AidB-like acyl-CoA dehydrogenase
MVKGAFPSPMELTFDAEVEDFLDQFVAFLDRHAPSDAEALERSRSSSDVPEWARRWQRLLFDNGWLVPGNAPEFGGRNATILQQYVHQMELARRRMVSSFNSQGVGIIAASLITFGTPEQQQTWAIPILRAEITAALGMSEPGAGSDLASLRTRAVRDGDEFVVNGQKVWTSGAHDADVILTFVRTDPDAPKHAGISVLLIPTDSPGLTRRPFASAIDGDELDFNEVFFTDVRVPAQNLVGRLNEGWAVASGSLGHERNMLWLSYADRLQDLIDDWRPATVVERDQFATLVMDNHALRLLGSAALARATRGEEDVAALSVLKLLGAETVQAATERALDSQGADGLIHPALTAAYVPLNLDLYSGSWADRYIRSFAGTIAGGTSEIQRNIIAQRVLGMPRR